MDSPGGLMLGFGCLLICAAMSVSLIIGAIKRK